MRFSCEKSDLQQALSTVQKAINSQNTLQVLGNILIQVSGESVSFSATNLEIAISTTVNAEVVSEGSITLPSRLFVNYISLVKNGRVDIELVSGEAVHITATDSETTIKGISATEFPSLPSITPEFSFQLDGMLLKQSIERVVFSCSPSSARPVLSGVLFWNQDSCLRLVGTDSYRLGEQKVVLDSATPEKKSIIPARAVQELSRIIQKGDTVEVQVSQNQVLFVIGSTEISSRLIEGNFPDYQRIIPEGSEGTIVASRQDLILAVKQVGIFAKEIENNTVKIDFTETTLDMKTDETEIGSGHAIVQVSQKGECCAIAVNAVYLLDILQMLNTEKIQIQLGKALAPVKILPEEGDEFVHVIMPLKV